MNLRAYLFFIIMAFLLLYAGCQQNPTEPTATKTSTISGTVLDAANNPLPLARVIDKGSLGQVDTSKTDGSYTLKMQLTDNYNTSLYAILAGYASDTPAVSLKPGDNLAGITIHMTVQDSSKIIKGNSGRAASIGVLSQTAKSILLKGGLIDQSSTITFLVVDSLNRPVTGANKCLVKFSISVSSPSGESLKPDTAQTDPLTGQVSTTVFSGTKPNAILVTAQVIDPVRKIMATAGLTEGTRMPDGNHVSISASKFNIAGRVFDGLSTSITMTVNDQFGNPVADGTPVSFVTNGGGITKDAFTINGAATATLRSGGGNPPIGGWVTVTAEVKGDTSVRKADSSIVRTIQVLFSGHTKLTLASNAANFEIPDGDMNYFDFTVSDDYGNPLVEGSSIQVTVDALNDKLLGSVVLKGDINVTIPNTTDTNWTHFRVWVIDKNLDSLSGTILLKITITSQNDNLIHQFSGYMRGITSAGASLGVPASIVCADSTQTVLYLKETGTNTQKRLTFIVKDINGNPVSKAVVNFTLSESPIGTTLSKIKDTTNISGDVSVDILSGYMQGEAKVLATTGSVFGYSLPIQIARGLPDSNAIFLVLNKKNMFNKSDVVGKVSVTLMDRYGYPAVPQIIRGTTSGGWVGLVPATIDGKTSFDLNGGSFPNDPVRGPGFGYVSVIVPAYYADVVGSVSVKKSIPFLFSGAPASITFDPTKVTGSTLIAPLAQNGSVTITYKIADANNRPLSNGNTFTVAASGAASSELQLSGDINVVPADDTTLATYSVTLTDKGGSGGAFALTFTTTGESGTLTKIITGTVVAPPSGYASSIQLIAGPNPTTISVKGTGATETSTLTFVVKDSLGNPLNAAHSATVTDSIIGGPGGGEFLSPTSVVTDANGKVTITVNAGTKAGVMQVVAKTGTIQSAPVSITIASGLADSAHFTVWTDKLNWTGIGVQIGTVFVQMGDKYANPVQPNTALYFTATEGIITSSAFTDATGHAFVAVYGGNPITPSGIDTITVSTLGQRGVTITQKVTTVYSGAPIITVASTNLGTIPVGGSLQVNYTVADLSRNPLTSGNTISVIASGTAGAQAQLSGNTSVTTTDTKDTNTTKYQFTVTNNVPQGGTGGSFTVTIAVSGPNGTKTLLLTGILASPVGTITAPTQIVLSSVSNTIIAANGTGGLNTSNLTFQALDAGGRAIGTAQSDTMFFSLSDTGGGAHLIPTWAMTDANGQASTKLYSGIKYGSPTITARMKTLLSQPVAVRISGPSWTNFNVTISANNLPGLSTPGVVGTLKAQVGDTLGNPVLAGTIIKFATSGGMVDASAVTDVNGSASVNISGGAQPTDPTIGWGNVTATIQGNNGTTLQKKIPFLFSGTPIITTLNVPANDTVIVFDAGNVDIDYRIADVNGNPLAAGNSVQVTVSGADASEIGLSNYFNFSTNGTTDVNQTNFRVRISDALPAAGTGGNFDVSITVNGPNGKSTRQFHGFLTAPGVIIPPSADVKKAAQIAFISISATDIFVSDVGALNNAVITYEVRDSLGAPVASSPRYGVTYSINFYPNSVIGGGTYPKVIPSTDSTDSQGRLRASIVSGTQAGVIQIVAQIVLASGKIINSQPVKITVHAGFPDQKHFTIMPNHYVTPGMDQLVTPYPTFTVAVGDTFSNPVTIGTAVYFHSQAGIIETGFNDFLAYTNKDGLATVNLLTVNPKPNTLPFYDPTALNGRIGGFWVYAQTQNRNGGQVIDSVLVVSDQGPIIVVQAPDSIVMPRFGKSGLYTLEVTDANLNPLPDGTTITVAFVIPAGTSGVAFDTYGTIPTLPFGVSAAGRFPGPGTTIFQLGVTDNSTPPGASSTTCKITISAPGMFPRTIAIPVTLQ
ncbi:MAG: Ig-like domain-containing protein [Bacteroidota bacterium]|jgi:hypothetical protein